VRNSQKTTISKAEKTIPAIAAAFGVFRFARVRGLFGIFVAVTPTPLLSPFDPVR
jgi:hypothetical protein